MRRGIPSSAAGKRPLRRTAGARLCLLAACLMAWTGTVAAAPGPSTLGEEEAVIQVDTTLDDSVTTGNCSLREAILAANSDTAVDACRAGDGADTILVPSGTYLVQTPGMEEDEGLTGDLDISESVSIHGAGLEQTRIDGNGLDRVFDVLGEDVEVNLLALTISGGRANCGGGIYNRGTVRIEAARLTENHAAIGIAPQCADGGAVYSLGTLAALETVFDHNTAEERGGAIFAEGRLSLNASSLVENSAYDGGGLFLNGSGELTTTQIEYNRGMSGGGIYNAGDLAIDGASVAFNRAQIDTGGGIRQLGTLRLRNSTVRANAAWGAGGGLSIEGGTTWMENSLLASNEAGEGGGGGIQQSGGELTALNSTLSGNQAALSGGGLNLLAGQANLVHTTVAGNIAARYDQGQVHGGGGISVSGGSLRVEHSIIGRNEDSSPEPSQPDCSASEGAIQSIGYNLVGQGEGCDWTAAEGDLLGTADAPLDIRLSPIADLGGPTLVHALLPGSPAIDAVTGSACPETDQRGQVRPQDGNGDGDAHCDAGAFEADPAEAVPLPDGDMIFLPIIQD